MAEKAARKQEKDYTSEVDSLIPELEGLVKVCSNAEVSSKCKDRLISVSVYPTCWLHNLSRSGWKGSGCSGQVSRDGEADPKCKSRLHRVSS